MSSEKKHYAMCECGQEMAPGSACVAVEIGGPTIGMRRRIPYDGSIGENCPDCNAAAGKMHHLGCDQVQCPFCHGQESFCECDIEEIGLLQ